MSKRFGRNQRRRLLAELATVKIQSDNSTTIAINSIKEIAKLQDRNLSLTIQLHETTQSLLYERGSVFRVADGEELWVIPEGNVRGFRETSEHKRADKMYEVDRTVAVDLIQFGMTEGLAEAMDCKWRHRELVSFRGIRWMIDNLEAYPRNLNGYASINTPYGYQTTVNLRAIGRSPING